MVCTLRLIPNQPANRDTSETTANPALTFISSGVEAKLLQTTEEPLRNIFTPRVQKMNFNEPARPREPSHRAFGSAALIPFTDVSLGANVISQGVI